MEKEIKAVIFDCDGVLVDSEIIASQVALQMLAPYGVHMELNEYARQFAGKVEEDTLGIIQQQYDLVLPDDFLSELRLKIEHGLDHDLKAIPGSKETIANIKVKKAVVSNSRLARVIHSLKTAGLTDFFGKALFAAEMVEKPKPDPAIYLHAAQQLHVDPSECLVVEDSFSGTTSAFKAGMSVIGFLGASHIYEGHEVKLKEAGAFTTAKDMAGLNELLQQLLK